MLLSICLLSIRSLVIYMLSILVVNPFFAQLLIVNLFVAQDQEMFSIVSSASQVSLLNIYLTCSDLKSDKNMLLFFSLVSQEFLQLENVWPLAVFSLVHTAHQAQIRPSLAIQPKNVTYRRTRFLEHPFTCFDSHNISERTHIAKRPCYCCCRQIEYLLQLYLAVPPDVSNSAWEVFSSLPNPSLTSAAPNLLEPTPLSHVVFKKLQMFSGFYSRTSNLHAAEITKLRQPQPYLASLFLRTTQTSPIFQLKVVD